jgi:hypothetical protein
MVCPEGQGSFGTSLASYWTSHHISQNTNNHFKNNNLSRASSEFIGVLFY